MLDYYELYTPLRDRYKEGTKEAFFLNDDRIKIIRFFPWGFIDHDDIIVKHIAWNELRKQ
jgi:hypothetical protein